MSDLTPFEQGGEVELAQGARAEAFKAPLEDFDWKAYEERQEMIDAVREDPVALAELVSKLSDEPAGVKLNNLHGKIIGDIGDSYAGLVLPLAIMTSSTLVADAPYLDFEAGVAVEATMRDRHLRGANLMNSVMPGVNFAGANLRGANMVNAILNGADFSGADLKGADARGAYLVNVRGLTAEQIATMDIHGARMMMPGHTTGNDAIRRVLASRFGEQLELEQIAEFIDPIPVSIDQTPPRLMTARNLKGLVAHGLQAREVDFTASNLTGATLEEFEAERAVLKEVTMGGAILRSGNLQDAELFELWAPGILVEDVNMRGVDLSNSNLAGALLRSVDLRSARGLEMAKTNTQGIILDDVRLPGSMGYDGNSLQPSDKLRRQLGQ